MYLYNSIAVSFFVSTAFALPSELGLDKRIVTPDNTCGNVANGNNHGYTCDPNNSFGGPCCSSSGYCGKTSAYCGTGCQSAFGICGIPTISSVPAAAPTGTGSPIPPKSGCAWVVDGTKKFTQHKSFDFSTLITFPTSGLAISTDTIAAGNAPYSQVYTKGNVNVGSGSLHLTVPGGQKASPISGAEVYTTDKDILYASVRTTVQVSSAGGTCHGNFFFKSNSQETDIEILTGNLASGVHYTDQNTSGNGPSTTNTHPLPADATSKFHEYRLDWTAGKTEFYLDGVLQQTFTVNVPSVAGEWLWNNWSNGDSTWSAGPPTANNVMKIGKIDMYYNRTGSAGSC